MRSSGLLSALASDISERITGMDLWTISAIFCGVVLVSGVCANMCVGAWVRGCMRVYAGVFCLCCVRVLGPGPSLPTCAPARWWVQCLCVCVLKRPHSCIHTRAIGAHACAQAWVPTRTCASRQARATVATSLLKCAHTNEVDAWTPTTAHCRTRWQRCGLQVHARE